MKKKSLKVKVVELAKKELNQTKGGLGFNNESLSPGKTCTQTGQQKTQNSVF